MPRPKTHKKITITIPIELDFLIETLVKKSQKTSIPFNKSNLIAVAIDEYLGKHVEILESHENQEGGN